MNNGRRRCYRIASVYKSGEFLIQNNKRSVETIDFQCQSSHNCYNEYQGWMNLAFKEAKKAWYSENYINSYQTVNSLEVNRWAANENSAQSVKSYKAKTNGHKVEGNFLYLIPQFGHFLGLTQYSNL
jgi:hypothetical protein